MADEKSEKAPQKQPSDTTSEASVRKDVVEDYEKLRNQLEGLKADSIQALSTRAALRVFPITFMVFRLESDSITNRIREQLVVQSFRALLVSKGLVTTPSLLDEDCINSVFGNIRIAADAAESKNPFSLHARDGVTAAAQAAAFALNTHSRAVAPVDVGITALRSAHHTASISGAVYSNSDNPRALARASGAAVQVMTQAFEADVEWIKVVSQKNGPIVDLFRQPLWLFDVKDDRSMLANSPTWARRAFDEFANSERVLKGPWRLITEWYKALLPSIPDKIVQSFLGEEVEYRLVQQSDEFWQGDATEVLWRIERNDFMKIDAPASDNPASGEEQEQQKTPQPNPDPEPQAIGAVRSHNDDPTTKDLLERRHFARALVEMIDRRREDAGEAGFAVHLHAPWGAGKSSVLGLMDETMTDKERPSADRWVCVHFNAWEHERRRPPWWPFLRTIRDDSETRLIRRGYDWRADKVRWWWRRWRLETDWFPSVAFIIVLLVLLAVSFQFDFFSVLLASSEEGKSPVPFEIFKAALGAIAPIVTAIGAFILLQKTLLFGSDKNAQTHFDITQDPLKRIRRQFKRLIGATGQPVCIFIDDLDRCHADYAVELLTGVQTAFRHPNVAYVVAADRDWIRTSFETVYDKFKSSVGDEKQPLGYLFLEKLFQVSAAVPGVPDDVLRRYWQYLLTGALAAPAASDDAPPESESEEHEQPVPDAAIAARAVDQDVERERKTIREQFGDQLTREAAEQSLDKKDTPARRIAFAHEIARSGEAEKKALHLLAPYVTLVSDNPRLMKRMLNAYALRQNLVIRNRIKIPDQRLARWTILEQRYPRLADCLADNPAHLETLKDKLSAKEVAGLPADIRPYCNNATIQAIIGATSETTSDEVLNLDDVETLTRGSRV